MINTRKEKVIERVVEENIEKVSASLLKITNELEESYFNNKVISHIDGKCNPTKESIEAIIKDIFRIIFPGFISNESVTTAFLKYYIASVLESLYRNFEEQIFKAYLNAYLITSEDKRIKEFPDLRSMAGKVTVEILEALPEIRSFISQDAEAAYRGDPAALCYNEIILSYPFIKSITVHRIAHLLYKRQVPIIPRMMSEWAHTQTGIDIHPGAQIGRYFFIDHGTGVVIGETTEIGDNVKIYQGVTLGALSFDKNEKGDLIKGNKRHPTLQDNVIVYANATVLGGKTVIGRNSVIGGNTWITSSVEENTVVTIDTPKLLFRKKNS
ncbi:MAG: serine O-acetyltransferase EpsC [Bacillota bacterium]